MHQLVVGCNVAWKTAKFRCLVEKKNVCLLTLKKLSIMSCVQ